MSSRHRISVALVEAVPKLSHILSQYAPESHNILPHLATNISAINPYQLNKRPPISLLILTGTPTTATAATAAGLNQPAPALVPIAVDKAEKGKREFSHLFFSRRSYPEHRGLVYGDLPLQTWRWRRHLADQLHRSIIARSLAVNSEQRRAQ